jgi:hypothetical protein
MSGPQAEQIDRVGVAPAMVRVMRLAVYAADETSCRASSFVAVAVAGVAAASPRVAPS